MAIWLNLGSKATIRSFREDEAIKKLVALLCVLAGPAAAQSEEETLVRFVGFLGDLRLTVDDVRADLVGADTDAPRVGIVMEGDASAAFELFTTTHVNQTVTFFVCGEQMKSVSVRAPIDSGYALSDTMPLDRARSVVAALNGEGTCP